MIHFLVPEGEDSLTISGYLAHRGAPLADRLKMVVYEELLTRRSWPVGTYVFAAMERLWLLNPALFEVASAFHAQASATPGVRVLNHPTRTLRRFDLLTRLHAEGRNDFRVARMTDRLEALRYPVFVRHELSHGAMSDLLHDADAVHRYYARALLTGERVDDLMVVEFLDTSDETKTFRKYSAQRIGDRIVARGMNYGRNWVQRQEQTEYTLPMLQEEHRYIFENPHESALREIFALAGVDYGRIDYGVLDGRIQTWEINVNPTIGRSARSHHVELPPEQEALREGSRSHSHTLFREGWIAIDTPPTDATFASTFDEATVREAIRHRERVPTIPMSQRVTRALLPLKPMIRPMLKYLVPVAARLRR